MNTLAIAKLPDPPHNKKNLGDSYLKFHFGQQSPAVLPTRLAQEVVVLPVNRLTPMPNMPAYIMGLVNRRSRVLWVVDLAQMLGLPGVETNVQHYNIVIISNGSATFGIIVQTIEGVLRLMPETIQSPFGQVSVDLVPYLRGCVLREKEILLVLDGSAICQSPLLQNTAVG